MASPVISFLSDYGLVDEFVGVCHGVIAQRCPSAHVIDISHAVPRHDVRTGALLLRDALPYMPTGVHLAIVDPGVGESGPGSRTAVALRTAADGQLLVGPDNGLLWLAGQALGGITEAIDIGASRERREPVSATFHGRDIFAPVAAALAAGAEFGSLGDPLPAARLQRLTLATARLAGDVLVAHVLRVDHFGNLQLNASREQLEAAGLPLGASFSLQLAGRTHRGHREVAFADVAPGELLLYVDSLQMAAIAINIGSAAVELGAGVGQELLIRAG